MNSFDVWPYYDNSLKKKNVTSTTQISDNSDDEEDDLGTADMQVSVIFLINIMYIK